MKRHKVLVDVHNAAMGVMRQAEKYNANEARYSRFCALMEGGMGATINVDLDFKDRDTIDKYFDSMIVIKKAEIARRIVESRGYRGDDDECVDIQAI